MSRSSDVANLITSGLGTFLRLPGQSANVFYRHAFVMLDKSVGYLKEAADTANFVGFGIVKRRVTGDGLEGDNEVEILAGPIVLKEFNVVGVDNVDDVGDLVYATADDTLTLSATANTKAIGVITRYYGSGTKADIAIFPFYMDQAL